MKKIVFILNFYAIIILSNQSVFAQSNRWQLVGRNGNGSTSYVDKSVEKQTDDTRRTWTKDVFSDGYYKIGLTVWQCRTKKFRILEGITYKPSGEYLYRETTATGWITVVPDSLDNGLTQGKMLLIINPTESDEGNRARVSQYENGVRVPSLIEIYNYARFAGVTAETLLNDNLDLPTATREPKSDSKDDIPPVGKKAKNSKIENGNSSFNAEDMPPIENTSEPDENSSSERRTIKPLQIQSDTDCIKHSPASGAI